MANSKTDWTTEIRAFIHAAGTTGTTPDLLEQRFPDCSRSTINRRLAALVQSTDIRQTGAGRATRYVSASPFSNEDIARYFAVNWQERPIARFREELLHAQPNLADETCVRLAALTALAPRFDGKFLANFLIDFSWGSSVLEGSTYSDLDTQALIEYGQRNKDKPLEDALLVLNHKQAIEYLWAHRELTAENICRMQAMLTDRHGQADIEESDHFLPDAQRGVPRRYEDVNLGRSAYLPPFRPESDYIARCFEQIVACAKGLPPVQAAFYLMTRIPYLQVFANGNKRTARLAANMPLLANGLLPISFVDFDRADYIRGMAAFYELGTSQLFEKVFVEGYVKSIVRSSDIPAAMKTGGFSIQEVAAHLLGYVQTGRLPDDVRARGFISRNA